MTDILNWGVSDILIACTDNLKGFAEAIERVSPRTEVQLCIVHQIRNSTKDVANKDLRAVIKALKWKRLSNYLRYPKEIRKIIYTNIIESFHSRLRKVTKSKRMFSSDMSLFKLLYLVQQNLKQDWQGPMMRWLQTYVQIMILFEERMTQP